MSAPVAAPEEKSEENVRSFSIPKEVAVTENGVEEKNASNFGHSAVKTMWLVGDIVWSKIPGHPWWPSMVAYEPNTAAYFKYSGRTRYYHVQFFGHQPMRGWATEKSIVLYQGKEHFLSLHLSSHGVPAHRVGTKTMPLWETAMKMADRAVPLNRHERQLCFTFKYNIQPKEESPSEGGLFTDILNGFVKPKAVKNCGKSPATPKTGKRGKGKRSVGGTEVACVNKSMVVEDGVSKTTLKKAMTGESVTDVVDDLAANLNQVVQTSHLQDNSGKQGKNKRRQSPGVKSKQSPGGGSKQSPAGKSKQVQDTSVNEDTADMKMDIDSPTLKHKIKRANVNPICPITGKRKRGRPPKDAGLLNVNSVSPDCELSTSAKKPKTLHGAKGNDGKKPSTNNCNNEKPDNASDSNSIASTDLETKLDVSKGTSKAKECVCVVCERPDALVFCDGVCKNAYHSDCLGLSCAMPNKFLCDECISGNHTCFICKKTTDVVQCSEPNCGKFYHLDCIKTANIKVEGEEFMCPLHVCSVCGPGKGSSTKRRRLTSCTRCPTAYHAVTCVVAGCLPITPYHLVCKRHFLADKRKAHHSHVNVNWCFVCSIGGTLICCESCPAAFHPECIDVPGIPEGNFFCRDCDSGKELLYGEIVWVKLGMYRWWPAKICNPNNIPNNIQNLHHQPGEFPVQFLGSHDYYWIHRGRVFCYQEGDKGSCTTGGKYLGTIFKKALEEAKEKYAEWQKAQDEKVEKLAKKPAQYKHLKVNRYTTATRFVVEESEWSACECSVDDENPCGPESHCLNRILFLECSPLKCPGKEKCQNQCFVKRQYLDCEPFKTPKCGWGLKAKEDAKKGRFVIEYVGELINDVTCRERVTKGSDEGVDNYYMLTIDKDCIVDAGPMGNLSRFMNHSCNPNCETQKWNVNGEMRVGLFAKHDIVAGEELLFDYQLDCLGNEKKKCGCGASNCSGFLGVRPKTQHAQLQEDKKKKMDLKKKKKKSKKSLVKNVHEDECFLCGDGGELMLCCKQGCSKCYHLKCLTIDKKPYGLWLCPWHFCDDCGKSAVLRCDECPNSFCAAHTQGQIALQGGGRYICHEHPPGTTSDVDTSDDVTHSDATQSDVAHSDVDAKDLVDDSENAIAVSGNHTANAQNCVTDSQNNCLPDSQNNCLPDSQNNCLPDSEKPVSDSKNSISEPENLGSESKISIANSENPVDPNRDPACLESANDGGSD